MFRNIKPTGPQFGSFGEDKANPIYLNNSKPCPCCDVYRTRFEFGYGKFKICRVCRDRGVDAKPTIIRKEPIRQENTNV